MKSNHKHYGKLVMTIFSLSRAQDCIESFYSRPKIAHCYEQERNEQIPGGNVYCLGSTAFATESTSCLKRDLLLVESRRIVATVLRAASRPHHYHGTISLLSRQQKKRSIRSKGICGVARQPLPRRIHAIKRRCRECGRKKQMREAIVQ